MSKPVAWLGYLPALLCHGQRRFLLISGAASRLSAIGCGRVMAADHGEAVGRCILVGLHMDAVGRDLLRWALHQESRRGDRIVAVHIYRKSGWYLP